MVQAYYFCQFSISLCCIVHFGLHCLWVPTNAVESEADSFTYTVRKMGLILRSIERMLKMQFSMARKFTLQPLRRYDVKPPKKTAQA
jgi:hypothetical protein